MTATAVAPVRPSSPELAALLERVAAQANQRERERQAPHEEVGWVKDAGLGRLRVPVAEGGGGADLEEFFAFLIDFACADSNLAHILRAHFWYVEQQLLIDDPVARERGLALVLADQLIGNGFSEQSSRPVGLTFDTTITPDPGTGGYRLHGTKYYSTGTLYSDYTQIWASTPEGRIAAAIIPLDRAGVSVEDDWDGFGQRLTGTGTTRLVDVQVGPEEYVDLGDPEQQDTPNYQGAFLQLYLQAVTAGILRNVRDDAVSLVRSRRRNFSHAGAPQSPAEDRQVLQVVGEISAAAFAAEALVLAAAKKIAQAAESVRGGVPDAETVAQAQLAAAQAKVSVDGFAASTASALFDIGGASATQAARNLDRHWRNVRTISTHNPTFLKASAIGDLEVNGTAFPANAYF